MKRLFKAAQVLIFSYSGFCGLLRTLIIPELIMGLLSSHKRLWKELFTDKAGRIFNMLSMALALFHILTPLGIIIIAPSYE